MKANTIYAIIIFALFVAYFVWKCTIYESFDPNNASDILSVLDSSLNWIDISSNGFIPWGYYHIPGTNRMTKVPNGFFLIMTDQSGNGKLVPYDSSMDAVVTGEYTDNVYGQYANSYSSTALDIQYHDSEDVIKNSTSVGTLVLMNGKPSIVPWSDISTNITYYANGAYPYGASAYVPSYEDSIRLTSQPRFTNTYSILSHTPFGKNSFVSFV